MKGVLFYFSGTGNTRWVAERFKNEFENKGNELLLKNIEDAEEISLEGYDFFAIGTPVHAELPPRVVTEFAGRLPKSIDNMKCLLYSTQGAKSGAAVDYIKRHLQKKGYEVVVQTSFRMANNYYFGFGIERSQEEIQNYCRKAEIKIGRVVEEFLKGNKVKESISGLRMIFGKLTAKSFNKLLPKLSASLTSSEDCSKCGLCLRNCPKSNITFENGHAVFHSKCIMCTRCIYLCPINAIRYKGKKINQIQKNLIKSLELK